MSGGSKATGRGTPLGNIPEGRGPLPRLPVGCDGASVICWRADGGSLAGVGGTSVCRKWAAAVRRWAAGGPPVARSLLAATPGGGGSLRTPNPALFSGYLSSACPALLAMTAGRGIRVAGTSARQAGNIPTGAISHAVNSQEPRDRMTRIPRSVLQHKAASSQAEDPCH